MIEKLFDYEGWDENDTLQHTYTDVTWKQDFGVFKAGEKCDSVSVNYDTGIIEQFDESGKVVKEQAYDWKPR